MHAHARAYRLEPVLVLGLHGLLDSVVDGAAIHPISAGDTRQFEAAGARHAGCTGGPPPPPPTSAHAHAATPHNENTSCCPVLPSEARKDATQTTQGPEKVSCHPGGVEGRRRLPGPPRAEGRIHGPVDGIPARARARAREAVQPRDPEIGCTAAHSVLSWLAQHDTTGESPVRSSTRAAHASSQVHDAPCNTSAAAARDPKYNARVANPSRGRRGRSVAVLRSMACIRSSPAGRPTAARHSPPRASPRCRTGTSCARLTAWAWRRSPQRQSHA